MRRPRFEEDDARAAADTLAGALFGDVGRVDTGGFKHLYRERDCIERVLGHLKINRAIATRYDRFAERFLGMLFIALARYWIKFVHADWTRQAG